MYTARAWTPFYPFTLHVSLTSRRRRVTKMSGPPTHRLSASAVDSPKQDGAANTKRVQPVPRSYDEKNLPSYKDGITCEEENLKRSRTCRFIEESGRILKLPRLAVATAMVLFHRFYAKHSFAEHDRFEVAVACILLAAKVEEAPKKLSTIIVECHALKCSGAARVGRSLPAPRSGIDGATKVGLPLDTNSEEYSKLKERILLLERVVLHTIAFELSIDHPYKFVVDQVRKWCNLRKVEYEPNSEGATAAVGASGAATATKMTNELVQYAMNYANDSLHTCLCLQYPAKQIALACAFMAAKFCNIRPVDSEGKGWLDLLDGMPVEILASICQQIMDLISKKQSPNGSGGREVIANYFVSIQGELDALGQHNSLISGPKQFVGKKSQDAVKRIGGEEEPCDKRSYQSKRPKY